MKAGPVNWNEKLDARLLSLNASGLTIRQVAESMRIGASSVQRRLQQLGVKAAHAKDDHSSMWGKPSRPKLKPIKNPPHISAFKAKRRGFIVPDELEPEYYELLKQGLSIAEAKRRLGIK